MAAGKAETAGKTGIAGLEIFQSLFIRLFRVVPRPSFFPPTTARRNNR
jgi:hypothetical protein